MRRGILCATLIVVPSLSASAQDAPLADHHQHLYSETLASLLTSSTPPSPAVPTDAADLIRALDGAGIKRAAVLSMAYIFSQPSRKIENDYEKVRAENDWTAAQVARYPDRLIGFCGLNPLKDYALPELERCAKISQLRHGLKLHFGNSLVDFHNPEHIERLRRLFRAANDHRMAIIVHLRVSTTYKLPYGRDEAMIFLNEILPAAPDVVVQIAHLGGAGGYERVVHEALSVFAEAIEKGDTRTKQLWFDVSSLVPEKGPDGTAITMDSPPAAQLLTVIANRIRSLGIQRMLYGTDALSATNLPRNGWAIFRRLPLTDDEFTTIAGNVPPYMW